MPKSTKNKVDNERLLKSPVYGFSSRFVVGGESSLVRISPPDEVNERVEEGEKKRSGPNEIRTRDPRHVKAVS